MPGTLTLPDLRFFYYGGGTQAERDYLQQCYAAGVSAQAVFQHVTGASGGTTIAVKDENVLVSSSAGNLNFIGSAVTAADAGGGQVNVTVTGGASATLIQDEGTTASATASTINFVGAGVTATGTPSVATVTIPGGSGAAVVQDEGSVVQATASTINFVGPGVTASSGGANTATVTVPTQTATGAAGGSLAGTYPNPTLAANSVNSAQITDGQVTNAELATDAVTQVKMADASVGTAELIDANVTEAKLVPVTAPIIRGRLTAGAGVRENLTPTQVTSMLDLVSSTNKGLAPASAGGVVNFLRADSTWAPPAASTAAAVSVVPQGQQTGTDVQAAINNLDTRVAAGLDTSPDFLRTQVLIYDDFVGTGVTAGTIGSLNWIPSIANSGVVAATAAGITDTPGIILLQRGTTNAAGQATIGLHTVGAEMSGHPVFIMEWRCQFSGINAAGTNEFNARMGLMNSPITPTTGFWFEYSIADTSWRARTGKVGVFNPTASIAAADTGWHRFRAVSDGGGTVTFTIDGANATAVNDAASSPGTADFFAPGANVTGTVGLAQRQMRIDYFYLLYGVTR